MTRVGLLRPDSLLVLRLGEHKRQAQAPGRFRGERIAGRLAHVGEVGPQLILGVRLVGKMHHHLNNSAVENRATVCNVTSALENRTATLRVWVELLSAGTVWIGLA